MFGREHGNDGSNCRENCLRLNGQSVDTNSFVPSIPTAHRSWDYWRSFRILIHHLRGPPSPTWRRLLVRFLMGWCVMGLCVQTGLFSRATTRSCLQLLAPPTMFGVRLCEDRGHCPSGFVWRKSGVLPFEVRLTKIVVIALWGSFGEKYPPHPPKNTHLIL